MSKQPYLISTNYDNNYSNDKLNIVCVCVLNDNFTKNLNKMNNNIELLLIRSN